jgi:hypothetical protein
VLTVHPTEPPTISRFSSTTWEKMVGSGAVSGVG